MSKPQLKVELEWEHDFRFQARTADVVTAVDGDGKAGPSPMLLLLEALAACAGSDVVEILRKGRQELQGLRVRATGDRREEAPHRYLKIRLEFEVDGPVERSKAERAVALSLKKYCSVYHTLRDDLELEWEVRLASEG